MSASVQGESGQRREMVGEGVDRGGNGSGQGKNGSGQGRERI